MKVRKLSLSQLNPMCAMSRLTIRGSCMGRRSPSIRVTFTTAGLDHPLFHLVQRLASGSSADSVGAGLPGVLTGAGVS